MSETLSWVAGGLFAGLAVTYWLQYSRTKSSNALRVAGLFSLAAGCFLVVAGLRTWNP